MSRRREDPPEITETARTHASPVRLYRIPWGYSAAPPEYRYGPVYRVWAVSEADANAYARSRTWAHHVDWCDAEIEAHETFGQMVARLRENYPNSNNLLSILARLALVAFAVWLAGGEEGS